MFPSETKDEDTYAYNGAGEMSEVKMLKGTGTLASLAFTRDNDGQVKTATSKGLPGEETPSYEYDANSRLTKGAGVAYEYDSANSPTKIGTGTYKYNSGNELETGPSLTYAYNEEGQRTKTTPSSGPATTYGYDQAGDLLSAESPKEGEVAEIKDSYVYNGDGLRVSQTIAGTTTYMAWDTAEELPLLLSDETNSYIYGPGGLPIEQIDGEGHVTYLHHDQQGSTRLLTGSAGTVVGKCTYSAYGVATCEGTATTPLGYDGQYTSSDTGLIYMRAREYDLATGQFLSVDPELEQTREAYSYAKDDPLGYGDPTGEGTIGGFGYYDFDLPFNHWNVGRTFVDGHLAAGIRTENYPTHLAWAFNLNKAMRALANTGLVSVSAKLFRLGGGPPVPVPGYSFGGKPAPSWYTFHSSVPNLQANTVYQLTFTVMFESYDPETRSVSQVTIENDFRFRITTGDY